MKTLTSTLFINKRVVFAVVGFGVLLFAGVTHNSYGETFESECISLGGKTTVQMQRGISKVVCNIPFSQTAPATQTSGGTDTYKPISPILSPTPGCDPTVRKDCYALNLIGGTTTYFQKMFQFALGIAGILAVLMIVIGGIQYMMSEAFTSKEDAKKRIWGALWGLLLLFASFIILNTINPALLNLQLNLKALNPSPPSGPSLPPRIGEPPPPLGAVACTNQNGDRYTTCEQCAADSIRNRDIPIPRCVFESSQSPETAQPQPGETPSVGSSSSNPFRVDTAESRYGPDTIQLPVPTGRRCYTYVEYRGQTYGPALQVGGNGFRELCSYRMSG